METTVYVVRLFRGGDSKPLMFTTHDYLPYAQKQAEVWSALYSTPDYTVTITMQGE